MPRRARPKRAQGCELGDDRGPCAWTERAIRASSIGRHTIRNTMGWFAVGPGVHSCPGADRVRQRQALEGPGHARVQGSARLARLHGVRSGDLVKVGLGGTIRAFHE